MVFILAFLTVNTSVLFELTLLTGCPKTSNDRCLIINIVLPDLKLGSFSSCMCCSSFLVTQDN